jgi:hypothetical protein
MVNKFIDHLYPPLRTTSNYSAIADLHTLQITTESTKHFPAYCVFTSRSLATASNSEDSSASVLTSLRSGEYPKTELKLNYSAVSS